MSHHSDLTCLFTDHSCPPSYSRYEAYDRVEGQAAIAEKTARLKSENDEELSSSDKKEIEKEKTHQLNMRHRGVMQYKAAR